MGISLILVLMALVLMAAAVHSAARSERYREEFTQELKELIQEATVAKRDMEALLQNAVLVADDLIRELDTRIDWVKSLPREEKISETKGTRKNRKEKIVPPKIEELRRAHPYIIVPRLYKEGYSIQEIAEILDRGQGEVKLILDLKKKREALG